MLWSTKADTDLRVKGYTLLETMLTLIIGLLVCLMSARAMDYVRSSFAVFNEGQQKIRQVLLLKDALASDFERSRVITANGSQFSFCRSKDTVVYKFDRIIYRRSAIGMDSFAVSVKDMRKSSINVSPGIDAIAEIQFDIIEPIAIGGVAFTKGYSSMELMSLKQSDESWNH